MQVATAEERRQRPPWRPRSPARRGRTSSPRPPGASARCASGARPASRASSASISSWDRKVNIRSSSPTWESSTFSHHWWKEYGDIISASSHSASPSVLPYLVPSGLVISGVTKAWACAPSARRISSTPAVMFPHWSVAAVLQRHAVVAVEVEEVHRLQQHVAELRVADPGLEPPSHDVALEHPVHREVLADVAQEVDRRQARRPVVVVDDRGGVRAVEADERLDLSAYPLAPVLDRVERVQRPLRALLRVTDHAGGAADQDVRRVAGRLQPARGGQLDEVAHVQARSGRVEADIEPHAPGREGLAQCAEVGRVGDQAAPHEVVEKGRVEGAGHAGPFVFGMFRRPACRIRRPVLHLVAAAPWIEARRNDRPGRLRARSVTSSHVGMSRTSPGNVGRATVRLYAGDDRDWDRRNEGCRQSDRW